MKIVIRIANRLRSAQPIPRDFMPIRGIEHLGLVFQQRVIETAEDFNATLAAINDPRFPGRGCSFFPHALTDDEIAKMNAEPAPQPVAEESTAEEETASVEETEQTEEKTPEAPAKFRLVENDIFMGDERVGGIYENGLRCSKGFADLRDEIEAWLNTQPQ